jgi:sec-independent protein translocase protein TatA
MGPLGWQETVFIVVLALLIFGPKKLPELGRTIGKAMTEFRRASSELKSTFDREMRSIETETSAVNKEVADTYSDTYNYDYSSYDSGYYDYGSNESSPSETSTASASATQGAESQPDASTDASEPLYADNTTEAPPYGTIAKGSDIAPAEEGSPAAEQKA